MIATSPAAPVKSQAMRHVDDYLEVGQKAGASDVHLAVNAQPRWRLHGRLEPIWPDAPLLTAEQTAALAEAFVPDVYKNELKTRGDSDFAYENEFARYRTSVVRQRLGIEIVFRVINSHVRTMDELGLPERLKLLTRYQNGLILATGSVGTGKSTTLAAMVEQVNMERRDHIITLEDPIEYILTSKNCHVTQREIFTHSDSFATALRASLREDPDVIMVGEMRDLETISLAITAAETGHLVLATLHTSSAARTLDRLLDVFPPHQQEQIRVMVSESLRGGFGDSYEHACGGECYPGGQDVHVTRHYSNRQKTRHAFDGRYADRPVSARFDQRSGGLCPRRAKTNGAPASQNVGLHDHRLRDHQISSGYNGLVVLLFGDLLVPFAVLSE